MKQQRSVIFVTPCIKQTYIWTVFLEIPIFLTKQHSVFLRPFQERWAGKEKQSVSYSREAMRIISIFTTFCTRIHYWWQGVTRSFYISPKESSWIKNVISYSFFSNHTSNKSIFLTCFKIVLYPNKAGTLYKKILHIINS